MVCELCPPWWLVALIPVLFVRQEWAIYFSGLYGFLWSFFVAIFLTSFAHSLPGRSRRCQSLNPRFKAVVEFLRHFSPIQECNASSGKGPIVHLHVSMPVGILLGGCSHHRSSPCMPQLAQISNQAGFWVTNGLEISCTFRCGEASVRRVIHNHEQPHRKHHGGCLGTLSCEYRLGSTYQSCI